MAEEKKKRQANPASSDKKGTKDNKEKADKPSSGKKNPQSRKNPPKKHPQSGKKPSRGRQVLADSASGLEEFMSLFFLAGGLLLAFFVFFPDGFIGTFVRDFMTGLFGLPICALPLLLIANGMHRVAKKSYEKHQSKYIIIAAGIGLISVMFHIFVVPKEAPFSFENMAENYILGTSETGGGLIGGFIADLLRLLIGQAASIILIITLLLALTMMLVNWSPVKLLVETAAALYNKTDEAAETVMGPKNPMRKKKQRPRQEEIPSATGEGEFMNFSDEELGIAPKNVVKVKKHKGKKSEESDTKSAPSEGIPMLDDDALSGIDSILDEALPEPAEIASAPAPTPTDADAPVFPFPSDHADPKTIVSENSEAGSSEDAPPFDADNASGPNIVDAPKRLEGMEDVSEEIEEVFERIPYTFPDVSLLENPSNGNDDASSRSELRETAQKLIATLKSFNVEAKLLNVSKGPTVTRYELMLGEGVKVSKVAGLANDLALRLAAQTVRIEPVPGKEAIGIEIPNKTVSMVRIKEVLDSDEFRSFDSNLAFAMGKDISGKNIVFDLSRMPHVLIAGSTGSGKSVCINTLITSLIYKADPNDVKLLMVDPKVVELGIYNGIPHLLIPVVTEPRRASGALYWAVQEMLRRYTLFADNNVRDIKGYNKMLTSEGKENTLPHIVIIIDELADLMMVAPNEVEDSICRLAQMARAAGMHLVIATQRPSVDVITGLIKANVPSRIAFAVSSHIDSRTILDSSGAEKLLGRGDMLFKPVGANKPLRIQGAFIDDKEVERVVEFIKNGTEMKYDEDIIEKIDAGKPVNVTDEIADPSDNDELLPKAIELAVEGGKISASHLQRRLKVGFGRASRMIDQMQERGIVSPPDGSKPREVLISKEEFLEMSMNE